MTTNQTIDGVPRELLAWILGCNVRQFFMERHDKLKELRALLDAPAVEPLELGYFEHQQAVNFECCPVDTRLIWALPNNKRHLIPQHFKVFIPHEQQWHGNAETHKPAAQPQGVPVAWVVFDNGFIDDHTVVKTVADEWEDRGLEVTPLYAEQPAPVAVADTRTPFEIEHDAEPGDEAAFRKWRDERPKK